MAYDLKNQLENLDSTNPENIHFEKISAFVPKYLWVLERGSDLLKLFAQSADEDGVAHQLERQLACDLKNFQVGFPSIEAKIRKLGYLQKVKKLKELIQSGDIYEANLCMEFYAEQVDISPEELYLLFNTKSPSPFSAFYKQEDNYLLSASPERFLAKRGKKIISQPMKGTIKRGDTTEDDAMLKAKLREDLKEQTENVMIVDVVRNDLSRFAERGSVQVEELFGIYSFPQVHQMISTITCEVNDKINMGEIIKATFPMASMTGAPKISAMKILDLVEESSRNLYSGSIGYLSPTGDFDCNVIIRSMLYNSNTKYLSYSTGGAITAMSDPEREYEECLLKAKAIFGK